LACHPSVLSRQASLRATGPSWRDGWGEVFSPHARGEDTSEAPGSTPGAKPSCSLRQMQLKPSPWGLLISPKPLSTLFPLHPFTLSCSHCARLDRQGIVSPVFPGPRYSQPSAWCRDGSRGSDRELGLWILKPRGSSCHHQLSL